MTKDKQTYRSGISRRAFLAGTAAGTTALLTLPKGLRAQEERTLRIAVTGLTGEVMDPMMEVRGQVSDISMIMFDSLLEIGPDNALVPGLAESWEVDDSGTVWTLKLREGALFHGGYGEVTAEDAVYSLERWMHPDVASSGASALRNAIKSVAQTGTYTLEITTNGARPTFPYMISPHESVTGIVLSKKQLLEAGEDFEAQTRLLNEGPIGSGPYQFESHRRGRSLTIAAFDGHWRAKPEARRVEFLIVPDLSTQFLMLQSGEIDVMQPDPDQAAQLRDMDGFVLATVPNSADLALNIYGTFTPAGQEMATSDPRVRKAISLAINRQAIGESLMSGFARAPGAPWGLAAKADGLLPEAFEPWMEEAAIYDPEQAKALMAEAGYPDGFTVAVRDSVRAASFPNPSVVALAVAQQLAEVGIKVEYTTQEYTTIRPYFVEKQDDAYIAGQLAAATNTPRFTSEAYLRVFYAQAGVSRLLKDDRFEALVAMIGKTMNTAEREAMVTEAMQILHQSWVTVPVLAADTLFAVNDAVVADWPQRDTWPFLSRQIELLKLT
ncbi:ABC transporter substrate-binding protein [Antarctobacter sp.]|uniref:ABC transporter substrate-binding protein n=1 Tax=Antarctobacter sp. TaxID=1872577 RepID=UPI003A8F5D64